jgi:hypothetical protein
MIEQGGCHKRAIPDQSARLFFVHRGCNSLARSIAAKALKMRANITGQDGENT